MNGDRLRLPHGRKSATGQTAICVSRLRLAGTQLALVAASRAACSTSSAPRDLNQLVGAEKSIEGAADRDSAGVAAHVVAASLGHESSVTTIQSYVKPEAVALEVSPSTTESSVRSGLAVQAGPVEVQEDPRGSGRGDARRPALVGSRVADEPYPGDVGGDEPRRPGGTVEVPAGAVVGQTSSAAPPEIARVSTGMLASSVKIVHAEPS
jgi:hypothetical protein